MREEAWGEKIVLTENPGGSMRQYLLTVSSDKPAVCLGSCVICFVSRFPKGGGTQGGMA